MTKTDFEGIVALFESGYEFVVTKHTFKGLDYSIINSETGHRIKTIIGPKDGDNLIRTLRLNPDTKVTNVYSRYETVVTYKIQNEEIK